MTQISFHFSKGSYLVNSSKESQSDLFELSEMQKKLLDLFPKLSNQIDSFFLGLVDIKLGE